MKTFGSLTQAELSRWNLQTQWSLASINQPSCITPPPGTNPEARQITADLLRSTANAIAPEKDGKTFQDRVKDAVAEKVMEEN